MKNYIAIFLILLSPSVLAKDFSWKNMSLHYAKIHSLFEPQEYIEDYIKEFYPKKWSQYSRDEFLFEEKKEMLTQEMLERINNYDLEKNYTIFTNVELGKYDFKNNTFPIEEGLSSNSYFYVRPENVDGYKLTSFPREYKLFFANPEDIRFEMGKEKAKKFVQDRKKSNGYVDRKVSVELIVTIDGFRQEGENDEFIATIRSYKYEY